MAGQENERKNSDKRIDLIGFYLAFYLIALALIPILAYLFIDDFFLRLMVFVSCSSGLGGTIYSAKAFYSNVASKKFSSEWLWWYVFRPITSTVFGAMAYFLLNTGFIAVNFVPSSNSTVFYLAAGFIAGYGLPKILMQFDWKKKSNSAEKK